MRIAVITTMKRGMEHFIFRELQFFASAGITISLFPTKYRLGLYNPMPDWSVHRWTIAHILFAQLSFLCRRPLSYIQLLWEAICMRALADFAIACCFSRHMADMDLLYATFGDHKLFVGYFCKRLLLKPLVVTIHAYELYQNPNPPLFARALRFCDQVITVTEYNRQRLARFLDIDTAPIEVVRCSVDTTEYRPETKFIILIVGFFVERKGHETLFRAVKQLGRDDVEVWVVGGKGAENSTTDVPALARELSIEEQVVLFGTLSGNALKAVYRCCDVFCLPCRTDSSGIAEGFPVALMEAMAFGKPVITTRHVEIPKLVPEVLVNENDVSGLASAILQLYSSSAARQQLGTQNRRIAEQLFSPANAAEKAKLLHRVVESHALPPRSASAPKLRTEPLVKV